MKTAVMQPTYLPWSGYFNLMTKVDLFVFLDDVQFEKQSWQNRNQILLNDCKNNLIVPVKKSPLSTPIKDIFINDDLPWRKKQFTTITQAYAKAPFGKIALELIEKPLLNENLTHLSRLNIEIIKSFASYLDLNHVRFFLASDIQADEKRTKHLIKILNQINTTVYLSPLGAKEYLEEDQFEKLTDIQLEFQNFQPTPYPQWRSNEFISHLSILDVIANLCQNDCIKYIRNGKI